MSCSVCCELFNKSNHKEITCSFCDYPCCRECTQKYLLSTSLDAHCMNCHKLWNREFIDTHCTKLFRDGVLKKHREDILFERERALMPETQILIEREREMKCLEEECSRIHQEISRLYGIVAFKRNMIYNLQHNQPTERRKFIRKCPVSMCKGFLSTQWKCGMCDTHICPDCNETKEEGHVCDENAVKTMDLIKKDSRPCPNCGTVIHKLSGCPQMWCPDCHCAYNWNTGNIEHGRIHNPHYYEFKLKGGISGRENGDIPCGGMPTLSELYAVTNNRDMFRMHRLVMHVQCEIAERYMPRNYDTTRWRMDYMKNNMTEEHFKQQLQRIEKKREKMRDISNIITMFVDTSGDMIRQFIIEPTLDKLLETRDQFSELKRYANGVLGNIRTRYGGVIITFPE